MRIKPRHQTSATREDGDQAPNPHKHKSLRTSTTKIEPDNAKETTRGKEDRRPWATRGRQTSKTITTTTNTTTTKTMGRRELEAVGAREGGWGLGGGYGAGRAEAGERGEHRRHRNPRRCAATPTTSPRDPTWRIPANHERAEEKKKAGSGETAPTTRSRPADGIHRIGALAGSIWAGEEKTGKANTAGIWGSDQRRFGCGCVRTGYRCACGERPGRVLVIFSCLTSGAVHWASGTDKGGW